MIRLVVIEVSNVFVSPPHPIAMLLFFGGPGLPSSSNLFNDSFLLPRCSCGSIVWRVQDIHVPS